MQSNQFDENIGESQTAEEAVRSEQANNSTCKHLLIIENYLMRFLLSEHELCSVTITWTWDIGVQCMGVIKCLA